MLIADSLFPTFRRTLFPVLFLTLAAACSNEPPSFVRGNDQVQAHYDPKSGKLASITYDANRNGRIDTWTYMNGPVVVRVEIDSDENGTIDRWEYYRPDNTKTVERVAWSRAGNGRPDTWAWQGAGGQVARIEYAALDSVPIAPGATGQRIQRTEFFENGAMVRAEEDANLDGRIDKWETWTNGALAEVRLDTAGTGTPDRRLVYLPDGQVRSEKLSDGGRD